MASGKIKHISEIKKAKYSIKPSSNLAAGAYGFLTFEMPDFLKSSTVLATVLALGHPGKAGGLQVTGSYIGGNYMYISYYTPIAVIQAEADIEICFTYM